MSTAKHAKKINYKRFVPFVIICAVLIVGLTVWMAGLIKPDAKCEHEYENGICKLCGAECLHDFKDGVCTVCSAADPDYNEIHKLSVVAVGDAMAHITNLRSQYNSDGTYYRENDQKCTTDGSFDWTENYQWIKKYIEEADLACVNIETTFAEGPEYSGKMSSFSVPDVFADNLKQTGFDVAFTCNNHSLDHGINGLKRTVKVLKEKSFTVVGSRMDPSEDRSVVIEVNGVKIGIVAYTYETGAVSGRRTLNGRYMPEGAVDLLNSYRYNGGSRSTAVVLDEDKALIAEQIRWCEQNGADIIIGYFHWDSFNEYVTKVTNLEKDLALFAAQEGVDIIFGSHPHVVQTIEVLNVQRDGKDRQVPVYYSLGNFISNQNKESFADLGDPNGAVCQEELIAHLDITYNKTKDEIVFDDISAIPLYVARYKGDNKGNRWEYRIFPLLGDYGSNEDLIASGQGKRADSALSHITEVIGKEYVFAE